MLNKNIKYKLVDTAGQITAVVYRAGFKNKSAISRAIMKNNKRVEQVAFLSKFKNNFKLEMMGNELSINGTLASAFINKGSNIYVSALEEKLKFKVKNNLISCKFPLNIFKSVNKNFVKLVGIGYLISNDKFGRSNFIKFCHKYSLPAIGVIRYKRDRIYPKVFVKKTNSLISENACGSGSLAYSLYSGYQKILQPSGQIIYIRKNKNSFTVKIQAKIVK